MSAPQFLHIETTSLRPRGKKRSMAKWVAEGLRQVQASKHVARPMLPTVYYGYDLQNLAKRLRKIKRDFEKKHICKLPDDRQLFAGAIVSWPVSIDAMIANPIEYGRYLAWREDNIIWFKKNWRDQLVGIVEHEDEGEDHRGPHLHIWGCAKEIDGKLTLGKLHPGQVADREAGSPDERGPAYRAAMVALQDRYWLAVSKKHGLARMSEDPLPRLPYPQWKIKKEVDRQVKEKLEKEREQERQQGRRVAFNPPKPR